MFKSIATLLAITTTLLLSTLSNTVSAQAVKYKCMVQMTNYMGEEAYVVVSLVNKEGVYEKTLAVIGDDKKWYPDLKQWHDKSYKKSPNVSTITGASIAGGDRRMLVLNIDSKLINKGYTIRFESAVEDQAYHNKDLEIPYTTEGLTAKNEGKGFIRYVRFSAN